MRASFLLVIAVAVLVGLGVAIAVKQLGLLSVAPAPETVVEKVVEVPIPQILVASRHLFPDDTIRTGDVKLRPLRADEIKDYEAHKENYVAPSVDAMYYRVPGELIEADSPIMKKALKPIVKPETLPDRLAPGTRAVNLNLDKKDSVGGLLGVGEWVDIFVTIDMARSDSPTRVPVTGLVVPAAQIVAKRNTLWTVFAGLPSDTIDYTFAMNTYRAGLLEYARTIGAVSIVPLSAEERTRLDQIKKAALSNPADSTGIISLGDPASPENLEEKKRIQELARGEISIGPEDLRQVLNLPLIPEPQPIPVPPKPLTVEIISNNQRQSMSFPVKQDEPKPVIPVKPEYLYFTPTTPPKEAAPNKNSSLAPRPVVVPRKPL